MLIELLIVIFAIYRLATDFAWEDGPAGAYALARGWVLTRYGAADWRSEGICCPVCWSFWLSLPVAFVWGPLTWLGVAGAVAFLVRVRHG